MFARPKPDVYVLPHERRVLRWRQHPMMLLPQAALTTVVLGVLVLLSRLIPVGASGSVVAHTVLWFVEFGMLLRFVVILADWWDDISMITDEHLKNVSGLIRSRMQEVPLSKITDLTVQSTFLGYWLRLGYGTIACESAGHDSFRRMTYIPNVLTVYEALGKLTSKKGLPAPAHGGQSRGGPGVEGVSAEWPEQ